MKKLVCLCFACYVFFSATFFCGAKEADETEKKLETLLYAQSAVLMDADSGRILFEKNGTKKMPNASTTKIMTCIVALEEGKPTDLVTVSAYAASMPDVQLHIKEGEQYYLKDLLYSLMLESHNDSAAAIAEHIGKQLCKKGKEGETTFMKSQNYVLAFAEKMNEKAESLGCKDTFFVTPNGLDAVALVQEENGEKKEMEHGTSAENLAKIMSYCILESEKAPEFLEITRTPSYTFQNAEGRSFSCQNHNAFLEMMPGAMSGKTGFTTKAGYCYVGALESEGRHFVVALLACGWPNHKSYKWRDTRNLMTYGMENYTYHDISRWEKEIRIPKALSVRGGKTEEIGETARVTLLLKKKTGIKGLLLKEQEDIQVVQQCEKEAEAPLQKQQQVGRVQLLLEGKVIGEYQILTKEEVKKIDYSWCVLKVLEQMYL